LSEFICVYLCLSVANSCLAGPDPNGVNRDLLRRVEDDAPVRNAADNHDEALAYEYLFHYAAQVPLDALRQAARHDLTFAHLFGPERYKYRGELVHVEGRLKRLPRPVRSLGVPGVGRRQPGLRRVQRTAGRAETG
jgi:hypothetical protein